MMKKTVPVFAGILLAVLLTVLLIPVSAYAEGINIISDSGDSISMFKNVKINEPVQGNIISVFGDVEIESEVSGQVITVFGNASINSAVTGQVVTVLGDTELGPKALIKNDMITIGQVTKAPGAAITGQVINMAGKNMDLELGGLVTIRVLLLLVFTILVFLTGMIYIAASGNKIKALEENIDKEPGQKLLLGFLAFTGATIVFVLLFITILVPLLYAGLIVFAAVISSIYLGKLILKIMGAGSRIYLEFVTGLLSVTLAELLLTLLIPGENMLISILLLGIISLLVNSFGVGTLFMEKFTKK